MRDVTSSRKGKGGGKLTGIVGQCLPVLVGAHGIILHRDLAGFDARMEECEVKCRHALSWDKLYCGCGALSLILEGACVVPVCIVAPSIPVRRSGAAYATSVPSIA
eukprot:3940301-Rhodomonas_salina.1